VHLADDGVAGDPAAELLGDLARAEPVEPELLQNFDPFVRPATARPRIKLHLVKSRPCREPPLLDIVNEGLATARYREGDIHSFYI
jgi:hypothetical protein